MSDTVLNKRKEWKKAAKDNLRKHYWILVVACLFASFMGIEFAMSFAAVHTQLPNNDAGNILKELVINDEDTAKAEVEAKQEMIKENDTNAYLGRSRGVFSMLVNSYSSGSFILTAADAVQNIVGSGSLYIALMILGALVIYGFVWFFIKETYLVILRRIVLESRTYEKIPVQRFLYPIQTKKWGNIAWVMMVKSIYYYLWSLTGIGGLIKKYSYMMVPYILAENPNMKAKEAIDLSRKMMNGHKWQCFIAELSFFGWGFLNVITLGVSGIFFSNPYKAAFFGEYYTYLRDLAKNNAVPGAEMLCDEYLYDKPTKEAIMESYPELEKFVRVHQDEQCVAPKGFLGVLSKWFGIVLFPSEQIQLYETRKANQYKLKQCEELFSGIVYPGRMAPAPTSNNETHTSKLMPTKSYTLLNLIMMFFIFSFIGWIWEVSLHLISDGVFVNRGVLHGPWLPIYGTGGILILLILKQLREKPGFEFITAVILCGCVEYYTAWHLELIHDGQKWWDYSGYFLNIHGRVCAEGLLVFGLGGIAIVYLVAPFVDNLLMKVNRKLLFAIACVLLFIYVGDKMYSSKYPNMGEGITTVTMHPIEDTVSGLSRGGDI